MRSVGYCYPKEPLTSLVGYLSPTQRKQKGKHVGVSLNFYYEFNHIAPPLSAPKNAESAATIALNQFSHLAIRLRV